jgi:hypothetical protein
MDDTLEMIREQMTETKSHLSDKLESLEHQVSDTVQSTGTAVNDTVAAVQKTVDSVTGAVQGAVQSVSNAFDVRRQFDRHPWLVLGGAVVVGYLAYELLAGVGKKSEQSSESAPRLGPAKGNAGDNNGQPAIANAATSAPVAAVHESGLKSSSWHLLRSTATGALLGIMQEVVARAVPQVIEYVAGNRSSTSLRRSDE